MLTHQISLKSLSNKLDLTSEPFTPKIDSRIKYYSIDSKINIIKLSHLLHQSWRS
jgi:hypothetical protein